jgi:hypothetical protein
MGRRIEKSEEGKLGGEAWVGVTCNGQSLRRSTWARRAQPVARGDPPFYILSPCLFQKDKANRSNCRGLHRVLFFIFSKI